MKNRIIPVLIILSLYSLLGRCQTFVTVELFTPADGLQGTRLCALPAMGLCKIEGNSVVPLVRDAPRLQFPLGMEVEDVTFGYDRYVIQVGSTIYSYDGDRLRRECTFEGGQMKMYGGAKNNVLLVGSDGTKSQLLDFDLESRMLTPLLTSDKEQFVGAFGCDSAHIVATRGDIIMYFGKRGARHMIQGLEPINAMSVTDYGTFFCTDAALYFLYGNSEALVLSTIGFSNILYDGIVIYLVTSDGYIYSLTPE